MSLYVPTFCLHCNAKFVKCSKWTVRVKRGTGMRERSKWGEKQGMVSAGSADIDQTRDTMRIHE